MKKFVMALDQGTTSSRAIIFDDEQHIVSVAQKEYRQIFPHVGWVEHNPLDIYNTQVDVLVESLTSSNIPASEIAAIGITNQRETTIVWDKKTGEPVYNAIVWQCRRTAAICEELKKIPGFSDYVRENTGLLIDAYFSATKLKWILDNVEGVRARAERGELLFGTVDTFLTWKLTRGEAHVTDVTNASRTMMFNIKTLKWDTHILEVLGIPECMLPKVCSSSEVYGYAKINGVSIPVAGIAGDQQAALFGQACFEPGDIKNTYGTGCFLLMNTGDKICYSKHGLVTTIAIGIDGGVQYCLEGSVFVGGSVIQWLRDGLKIIVDSKETEAMALSVPDNGGVYIVPAFTGLGAPYWDMYARGAIFGLTRGTDRNHIARAALEAIAFQTHDLFEALAADSGIEKRAIKADGGASANNFLMQFQADINGTPVMRPTIRETTALGAAYLAGLATGVWKNRDEIKKNWTLDRKYLPEMPDADRSKLLAKWSKAVSRSLDWEKD
jgi:glycerol kinase